MRESRPFTNRRAPALAAALFLITACGDRADRPTASADASNTIQHWTIVQAYLDLDSAWHGDLFEQKEKGPHPDITLAVAAAKRIVAEVGHPKRLAAAEFLVEHPSSLSETVDEDVALGAQTLQALIGPDWSTVETYKADVARWERAERELDTAEDLAADARQSRRKALGRWPAAHRAIAAARAIAAIADHARRRDAIEHLALELGRGHHVLEGAYLLLADFPAFERWPEVMQAVDRSHFRVSEEVERFYEQMSVGAADAAVRATARYFLATRLTSAANEFGLAPAEREVKRERALQLAVGLSEGLAEQTFVRPREYADDGTPVTGTFAQAEADLVHRIEHVTAGGRLAEATGKLLDGTPETLAAYAGKAVLIDFWATWCGPCVAALPKLRDLRAELPKDRFALLSISVDDELETVTDFQRDEPMPWANWHVGDKSKLGIAWDVRAYPTYILVDEHSVIRARTNQLSEPFLALLKDVVHGPIAAVAHDATEVSGSASG